MQQAVHGYPVVSAGRDDSQEAPTAGKSERAGGYFGAGPRWSLLAALAMILLTVAWAAISLLTGGTGFVVLVSDKMQGSEEAVSAVARLFAALVLVLFSTQAAGKRVHWVAGGLIVLGLSHLASGYLEPIFFGTPNLNEGLYEGLVTRTLAGALFVIGLVPRTPLRISGRAVATTVAAFCVVYLIVFEPNDESTWLPALATVDSLEMAARVGTPSEWLTAWHWTLSSVPFTLALLALYGAFKQSRQGLLRDWRFLAMVLFTCSALHEYLWPSAYLSGVLTTAEVLRLAFAGLVAAGGFIELRRVAAEREFLLATERRRIERLGELARLKADFSAMVAHELGGPAAAIRKLAETTRAARGDEGMRDRAVALIENEVGAIERLIADVRAASAVERDDFRVEPRPMPLASLIDEASGFADTLPGEHPVRTTWEGSAVPWCEWVLADPGRIGQVLRNLLQNAAKYTPDGTPIEIRVSDPGEGRVRVEVVDRGPGIGPREVDRIFEKFGRGCDRKGRRVSGVGLGLYLSRRILQGHGADLTVQSSLGDGSTFGFELERAR